MPGDYQLVGAEVSGVAPSVAVPGAHDEGATGDSAPAPYGPPGLGSGLPPGRNPAAEVIPERLLVPKLVMAGVGFNLHAFVIEYTNGVRKGAVMEDNRRYVELHDADRMSVRAPMVVTLNDGEYISGVSGYNSHSREGYLAHTLSLHTSLPRTLTFAGLKDDYQGSPFSHRVPDGYQMVELRFGQGRLTSYRMQVLPDTAADLPRLDWYNV